MVSNLLNILLFALVASLFLFGKFEHVCNCLLILRTNGLSPDPSVVVSVTQGMLEGDYEGVSRDGHKFYQFLGIQYAIVPGRFELAAPPESWDGVKSALTYGPTCTDLEEENCLYLNVFTPKLPTENATLRPTLIYIHGGAFQYGSNRDYGANYFMDENIVLVVIQYRLGVLGFLSTGDGIAPGNNGLKDQVMAMKWVQQNIHAFGGDKDRVTIMGQSAGSASVTFHLVSPLSRGLFHNAIAESGTFLDPWAITRDPLPYAERLAEFVNCPTDTSLNLVNCLKTVSVEDIQHAKRKANVKWNAVPIIAFGPVIEPASGNPNETFLPKSPYELLADEKLPYVPLLTGVTKEEGIYIWAAYVLYSENPTTVQRALDLQNNWTLVAPAEFCFDEVVAPQDMDKVSLQIRDFYFGDKQINKTTFYNLAHAYSDRLFFTSAVKFINLYSKQAPVYPYLYTFNKYVGIEWGLYNLSVDHHIEATHSAELDMLFSPFFNQTRNESDHDALSKFVVKLWTSFIYTGMPIETLGTEDIFPPVDSAVGLQKWYQLDSEPQLVDNPFAERIAFWNSLPLNDDDFSSRVLPKG